MCLFEICNLYSDCSECPFNSKDKISFNRNNAPKSTQETLKVLVEALNQEIEEFREMINNLDNIK